MSYRVKTYKPSVLAKLKFSNLILNIVISKKKQSVKELEVDSKKRII